MQRKYSNPKTDFSFLLIENFTKWKLISSEQDAIFKMFTWKNYWSGFAIVPEYLTHSVCFSENKYRMLKNVLGNFKAYSTGQNEWKKPNPHGFATQTVSKIRAIFRNALSKKK